MDAGGGLVSTDPLDLAKLAGLEPIAGEMDDLAWLHPTVDQCSDRSLDLDALAHPPGTSQHIETIRNDVLQHRRLVVETGISNAAQIGVIKLPVSRPAPPRAAIDQLTMEFGVIHSLSIAYILQNGYLIESMHLKK